MDLRKNNQKLQELVKHLKDYGYNVDPYMLIMVSDFFKERCKEQLPIQRVMPSLLSLNFREMRKTKGLTLREVEETTGISNAYLSQLETGKIKSPGYETVKLLYDLYSNEA